MTEVERSTQRWRWTALVLYLVICFYDFLFVPVWYGINRPDISAFMEVINATEDKIITVQNKEFKLTLEDAQALKKIYEDLNDVNKKRITLK